MLERYFEPSKPASACQEPQSKGRIARALTPLEQSSESSGGSEEARVPILTYIYWPTVLQFLFNRPMYSSLLVANCGSSRCFAAPHSFSSLLLAPVGR